MSTPTRGSAQRLVRVHKAVRTRFLKRTPDDLLAELRARCPEVLRAPAETEADDGVPLTVAISRVGRSTVGGVARTRISSRSCTSKERRRAKRSRRIGKVRRMPSKCGCIAD